MCSGRGGLAFLWARSRLAWRGASACWLWPLAGVRLAFLWARRCLAWPLACDGVPWGLGLAFGVGEGGRGGTVSGGVSGTAAAAGGVSSSGAEGVSSLGRASAPVAPVWAAGVLASGWCGWGAGVGRGPAGVSGAGVKGCAAGVGGAWTGWQSKATIWACCRGENRGGRPALGPPAASGPLRQGGGWERPERRRGGAGSCPDGHGVR